MNQHTNETLAQDISDLAALLLEHPEAGPIIRDAGVRRSFTEEEDKILFEVARCAPMMNMFNELIEKKIGFSGDGWYWNPKIAIGLARQIADGRIASVDAPEAAELIERNQIPVRMASRNEFAKNRYEIPISFNLYHQILKDFVRLPDFEMLRQIWINDDEGDRVQVSKYKALNAPAEEIQYRYGEIGGNHYASVANSMILKGKNIDDPKDIWDHFVKLGHGMEKFIANDRKS